jgi:hypothetical protein
MTRIRRAKGGWEADPRPLPGHFERADGTFMTQDEIAAMAKTISPQERSQVSMARQAIERAERAARRDNRQDNQPAPLVSAPASPPHRPPAIDPAAVWEAVKRLGTQVAAAAELGLTQGGIQSALNTYMRDHGIDGPRPGLLPPEERGKSGPKPKQPVPQRKGGRTLTPPGTPTPAEAEAIAAVKQAPEAPAAAWRERLEERYVDLLLRRAEEAAADDPVFDRIERLVGMLAP